MSLYPVLRVFLGAFLISFSAPLVRWAHTDGLVTGFYRMSFGGVALLFFVLISRRWEKPSRSSLKGLVVAGTFFAMDLYFWHESIHLIGPGLATVLANCQVFFLLFVGIVWWRQPISPRFLAGVVTVLTGLVLLVGRESIHVADQRWGVLLGLGAAGAYAAFMVALRSIPSSMTSIQRILWVSFVGAGVLGLVTVFESRSLAIPDQQTWWVLVTLALCSQVFGWTLISSALGELPLPVVGLLLTMQPALSFGWDVLFFGKSVEGAHGLGLGLALVGIYWGLTTSQVLPSRPSEKWDG
ncbi:MAG: DMT family transporter [Myxococcales bacterium]|nr:DMT family transporter [Myxococcales bacterium]